MLEEDQLKAAQKNLLSCGVLLNLKKTILQLIRPRYYNPFSPKKMK